MNIKTIAYKNWKEEKGKRTEVTKINFRGYVLTKYNVLYRFRQDKKVYVAEKWECLTEDEELREFIFRSEYIDDGDDDVSWSYTALSDTQTYCTVPNSITDYRIERKEFEQDGLTIYKRGFVRRNSNIFLDEENKKHKLRIRALNALVKHKHFPSALRKAIRLRRKVEKEPCKSVFNKWNSLDKVTKDLVIKLLNLKLKNYE